MPPTSPSAFLNNHFVVEIDQVNIAGFLEVILPEARLEVIEYREGARPNLRKLPGLAKYSNLVLRRGVTVSNELFEWWMSVSSGASYRRPVSVALLDEQLQEVKRWTFKEVWPALYSLSPLSVGGEATTVVETLECVVEEFTIA